MECPNCQAMMHWDGEIWECLECGETLALDDGYDDNESETDWDWEGFEEGMF